MPTAHELGLVTINQTSIKIVKKDEVFNYHFIIDFNIAHSDGDGLIKFIANFIKYLTYCSGYNSSVFEVGAAASHSECLAGTGLPVA